jgi:L-lactate dehydrogenase (cytochrome)
LWALAAQGETGVDRMLAMLTREIEVVMTLAGCNRISALDRTILQYTSLTDQGNPML